MDKPRIVLIAGPTGSGKSVVSVRLAEELRGEIVSVDSAGVYAGASIGTAQPNEALRARVKHHLVGHVDLREQYHAGRFVAEAKDVLRSASDRGTPMVAVGGTTLYITALLSGLVPVQPGDAAFRATLAARSSADLYAELQRIDSNKAVTLHPNDRLRIERALELAHTERTPASEIHRSHGHNERCVDALIVVLCWPRPELYARIDSRVLEMFQQGLWNEVWGIVDREGLDAPVLSSVGYAEVVAAGRHYEFVPEGEVVAQIQQSSRRYAKRQMTYWRNEPRKRNWPTTPPADTVFRLGANQKEYELFPLRASWSELVTQARTWLASSEGTKVMYLGAEDLTGIG